MASKLFLIINGLIMLYLILKIIGGSRRKGPTPLNFDFKVYKWPHEANPSGGGQGGFRFGRAKESGEKSLNCHFQYDGITWDAFEVFGVPAGADRETCWAVYNDLKRKNESSPEFLKAAWAALERHFAGK
jgi:hypothetical protein